jgi:uncharacterized membrane protein
MATGLRRTTKAPTGRGATPRSAARKRKKPQAKIAVPGNRGIKVVRAVTIRRPAAELYAFWRNLENLAQVIHHPVTITATSPEESHWSVSAPGKRRVEWNALVINDHPDRLIAWRSREGADVENAGTVRFDPAPGEEGTEVTVTLEYNPPGGRLGAAVAKLTRDSAAAQVGDALRRFKALMEAGEIPTIEGQPRGGNQRTREKR